MFDIAVVGAGIHGVGVAQAAAASGYSVVILEQTGIASATSGRSSKLIHGGLRYLEQARFSLVRECLRERELLLKLAPGLVRRVAFHIPVYGHTSRSSFEIGAGLSLYSALGFFKPGSRFRRLAEHEWEELDGLNTDGLQCVFRYFDCQTDDVLLTRAVLKSAQSFGAELIMPASFEAAEIHDKGCEVHYRTNEQSHTFQARTLVNASGPWINMVLNKIRPLQKFMNVELIQGTHIVVDGHLDSGMYYMEALQDRRPVFAMPWKDSILIGTTEKIYSGDPASVHPCEDEITYLCNTFVQYFPSYSRIQPENIKEKFAGIRVLPASQSRLNARTRECLLLMDSKSNPRVLSVYGGKLTTFRSTAQKVLGSLFQSLPVRIPIADTRMLTLLS